MSDHDKRKHNQHNHVHVNGQVTKGDTGSVGVMGTEINTDTELYKHYNSIKKSHSNGQVTHGDTGAVHVTTSDYKFDESALLNLVNTLPKSQDQKSDQHHHDNQASHGITQPPPNLVLVNRDKLSSIFPALVSQQRMEGSGVGCFAQFLTQGLITKQPGNRRQRLDMVGIGIGRG